MDAGYSFSTWFLTQWPRAALPCAVVILALLPVLANEANRPLILLTTLLPVYMFHQYEEHAHGRFQTFFNEVIGHGKTVLTLRDIFWVNIGLVWILYLISFYLARFVALEYAFVPIYLMLINGLTHLLTTLKLRRFNPGLWSSLLLFFPWGGFLLIYFNNLPGAGFAVNLAGFLVAAGVHVGIVVFALRKRAALTDAQSTGLAASA